MDYDDEDGIGFKKSLKFLDFFWKLREIDSFFNYGDLNVRVFVGVK